MVFLILILMLSHFSPLALPTTDFPVGLTLVYEVEDEYYNTTIYATESFEVEGWITPENTSFHLLVGYSRDGPWEFHTRDVYYPSWEFMYFDEEFNETINSVMVPLWTDVSNWEPGINVTLMTS
jgi:hypothetical protein